MTTWMNLEGITLSEISQTEKEKDCMISLIRGLNKKVTLIETEIRKWLPGSGGGGSRRRFVKGPLSE